MDISPVSIWIILKTGGEKWAFFIPYSQKKWEEGRDFKSFLKELADCLKGFTRMKEKWLYKIFMHRWELYEYESFGCK